MKNQNASYAMSKSKKYSQPSFARKQNKTTALAQPLGLEAARKRLQTNPNDANALKAIALHCLDTNLAQATETVRKALELNPTDPETLLLAGRAHYLNGDSDTAIQHLQQAVEIQPAFHQAHFQLANIYYQRNQGKPGLEHIDLAINALGGYSYNYAVLKGNLLNQLHRQDEALELFEQAIKVNPEAYPAWNNAGNSLRDIGRLDEALEYYKKATNLAKNDSSIFSNYITAAHYHPEFSAEKISQLCKEWPVRFGSKERAQRPVPAELSNNKKLRIGMFSDGFRTHPVGQMITTALEHIQDHEIELYLYSSSHMFDHISARLKAKSKQWKFIKSLSDEDFAKLIISDEIDILFDLSGHNSGTRMGTIALEPAPIIVKWVGGLINTTGVPAIDYLITDNIETPDGVDSMYTEKLIRMPDDYICYNPPSYTPDVQPLPALSNGHITFGCFNNPSKLNKVILEQWAKLLNRVEGSKLFLKGFQFESHSLKRWVTDILLSHGVAQERIIIEGASPHKELLEKYGQVDIALDPWPYSGGLTTCEAMIMGVPVVTLPGPTFAGRHSATHLVNAQMPELVTNSWEEYIDRAIELASDLESLNVIRTHLRQIILESNLCDGKRFARNFSNAMRAIWQRYCEGKQPSALHLKDNSNIFFADEKEAITLSLPEPSEGEDFNFEFKGKILVLAQHADFIQSQEFTKFLKTGVATVICFDPANKIATEKTLLNKKEDFYHIPAKVLGDGSQKTLYICMNAELSGTINPSNYDAGKDGIAKNPNTKIITSLPIQSHTLESISGLERTDLIVLDNLNENREIINQIKKQDVETRPFLVHIKSNLRKIENTNNDIISIRHLLENSGYCLYKTIKINRFNSHLYFTDDPDIESEEFSVDSIFIPEQKALENLENNRKIKLSLVLDSVYGLKQEAYQILRKSDESIAEKYKKSIKNETKSSEKTATKTKQPSQKKTSTICVGIPCFNEEEHIEETIQSLLNQNYENVRFIISDNASTDRTVEIIQDLVKNDNRFFINKNQKNRGAFENFKYVFEIFDSDYFMWLGAHDYLSDNYIEKMKLVLDDSDEISMAIGQPFAVHNSKIIGIVNSAIYEFNQENRLERYFNSVKQLSNCTIFHSMFRKNDVDGRKLRQTISADHVTISRLLWHGKLHFCEKEKYFRRYFSNRTSTPEERITGRKGKLPLVDFFDYYCDDFKDLARGNLPETEIIRASNTLRKILKLRFNK